MRHHTSNVMCAAPVAWRCLCDICYRQKNPEAYKENARKEREANEKRKKITQVIKSVLGIPMNTEYSILSSELYNIFMDDEKCEALISKLKNKAFW